MFRSIGLTRHVKHWKLVVVGRVAATAIHRGINYVFERFALDSKIDVAPPEPVAITLRLLCSAFIVFFCDSIVHNEFVRLDPDSQSIPAQSKAKHAPVLYSIVFALSPGHARMNSWSGNCIKREKVLSPVCVFFGMLSCRPRRSSH